MDTRILAGGLILLILIVAGGYMALEGQAVDCDRKYNQTIEGEIEPGEIPEECRPLPDKVEDRILAQALTGS